MLERAGYEVVPAYNGKEALSFLAGKAVHGLLFEYDLPDTNGASVREEMKQMNPDVLVPLFSGVGPQMPMLLRFFSAFIRQMASNPTA
jgi:CheY-like chemotaxis protein